MKESEAMINFLQAFDPKKGNKTKFNKIIANGDFSSMLDAIKSDLNEKELDERNKTKPKT